MADIEQSLKIFGQLIGLLDNDGNIQWVWFGDPKEQILGKAGDATLGLPAHRQYIGKLIRSLKGGNPDDADADFTDHFSWVPLNDGQIQVGFVWSKDTRDLQIGFGSQADFTVSSNKIDLAVLAKLIKIQDGTITPIITDLLCSGKLPAPSFLKSIGISGETVPPNVTVDVTNKTAGAEGDRKLIFSSTTLSSAANESIFAWDCARIALFVLESWIHDKATPGGTDAFSRIDHHGFPMFGEPASAIQPFPLFGSANMQKAPDFGPWRDSVIKFDSSTAGALAFLWHLRALVTGNESSDFLTSSVFMPLVSGAAGGSPPTTLGQATGTYDPTASHPAGVWIGLTSAASVYALVIDIQSGTLGKYLRIPLVQVSGTTITRPNPPSLSDLNTFLSSLPASSGVKAGTSSDGFKTITYSGVLTDAAVPFLNGTYNFEAVMSTPVRFEMTSTQLPITLAFPPESAPSPPSPGAVIGTMVNWVIAGVPAGAAGSPQAKLVAVAKDLGTFVAAELKTPGSGNVGQLLLSIGEALADGAKFELKAPPLDFTLALAKGNPDTFFHVKPGVSYGPIKVDQLPSFPISVGSLYAALDLAIDQPHNPLFGFTIGFDDLRLGDAKGGATGLIASLIPNLKDAPGFHFQLDWSSAKGVQISGGGKIPIQLTLGPLSLSQLLVDAERSGLTIGINLTFQLSVITVSTYELGLSFDFKSNIPTPNLQGLGLSFDGAGIKLSGLFLNNKGDYIGGAAVDIEDLFSLSAIGGYTQLKGGQASLFIFASLMAPLGGPPFFFVTGIAGGFGYNRMLPPATLMANHPFFKIMSGEIPISSDPKQGMGDLTALDDPKTGFAPKAGDYWIAAGIQFISFGFIHGKVVVAVALGHDFSINILGIASFGIEPVAYFEIDILVTVDAEKFLLVAGVSKNSYLVHPDLFSLSGDFGLGVWHSGPHQGDFLLSIGGYHPYFKAPDYYPDLARVSVKAIVFGFVHLTVECFFACTPQALMAGASVSLSAEFAGIGAGLDVYIDVFIQWKPFFILASMGVDLWFEFLGRHEIGVDLTIHTPPFGGVAHVSLFIVSFDVSFGDSLDHTPPKIPVADFFSDVLGVPATPSNTLNDANVVMYNTAAKAGLVRIIFTSGKTIKDQADTSKVQEGTDSPVKVSPEFEFLVRTHLPFTEKTATFGSPDAAHIEGVTHLPLCLLGDLTAKLTVTIKNESEGNKNIAPPSSDISPTFGKYPLANFGDAPLVAQGDDDSARQSVAGIDTSQPAIELLDGMRFNVQATENPSSQVTMKGPEEQLSDATENYPLPLGWPPSVPPVFRMPKSKLSFLASASASAAAAKNSALLTPKTLSRGINRLPQVRQLRLTPVAALQAVAPKIVSTAAQVKRAVRSAAAATTTVAAPPAGVPAMQVPASPARRAELSGVTLRSMPARTAAPSTPPVVKVATATRIQAVRNVLSAPVALAATPAAAVVAAAAAAQPPKPTVTVTSGHAAHLAISSTNAPAGKLTFAGTQTVRAIFMTAFGEPVADQYVTGNQAVALPARARNVLLIGEGALAGAPASLGSLGAEAATSLYAIGPKEFAAHGCVVQTNSPLLKSVAAGDTLTGQDVLPASPSLSFFFPAPQKGSSVVITLSPAVANPAAVPTQVRWRSVNATLSGLNTVANADHAALVMDLQAAQPWSLDIDVTTDWDLAGVAVCNLASADVLTRLRASDAWTFIDDRFVEPASPMSTTVTLEITNG
jgi:hypothetical protein